MAQPWGLTLYGTNLRPTETVLVKGGVALTEYFTVWRFSTGSGPVSATEQAASRDDDLRLLKAVAAGDVAAFEELYRRHARSLFAYIYSQLGEKQLSEEALQDVVLALWRGARWFRGEASVRTWLFAVARRRCLTLKRRRSTDIPALPEEQLPPSELPTPLEAAVTSAAQVAVREAIGLLPVHQREVIELVYLHGLSGREAAEVLRVPVGTVKSRLHRALKVLAPLLEEVAP